MMPSVGGIQNVPTYLGIHGSPTLIQEHEDKLDEIFLLLCHCYDNVSRSDVVCVAYGMLRKVVTTEES